MQYKILREDNPKQDTKKFIEEVDHGLSAVEKTLPSKYFYDDAGSILFEKITKLGEYYPTNAEIEVITKSSKSISELVVEPTVNIIELGAGANIKTKILLDGFLETKQHVHYIPIDISKGAMGEMEKLLDEEIKSTHFSVMGIVGEYFESLEWLHQNKNGKKNVVCMLGSNIGNFNMHGAGDFLKMLNSKIDQNDYVILGFDLKKEIPILERAYNDSEGITSEFNLNLLGRINNELGGNFNISNFRHHSFYDPRISSMTSWLISTIDQEVEIKEIGKTYHFTAWEGIQTEYSVKYDLDAIQHLAESSGFEVLAHFSDDRKYFVDSVWRKK